MFRFQNLTMLALLFCLSACQTYQKSIYKEQRPLEQAKIAFADKDYAGAVALYERSDLSHIDDRLKYAESLQKVGQYQTAYRILEELYQQYPESQDVIIQYGITKMHLGDFIGAGKLLRIIPEERQQQYEVALALGLSEVFTDNIKVAKKYFLTAMKSADNIDEYQKIVLSIALVGDFKDALLLQQKIYDVDNSDIARFYLSLMLASRNELSLAKKIASGLEPSLEHRAAIYIRNPKKIIPFIQQELQIYTIPKILHISLDLKTVIHRLQILPPLKRQVIHHSNDAFNELFD